MHAVRQGMEWEMKGLHARLPPAPLPWRSGIPVNDVDSSPARGGWAQFPSSGAIAFDAWPEQSDPGAPAGCARQPCLLLLPSRRRQPDALQRAAPNPSANQPLPLPALLRMQAPTPSRSPPRSRGRGWGAIPRCATATDMCLPGTTTHVGRLRLSICTRWCRLCSLTHAQPVPSAWPPTPQACYTRATTAGRPAP